MGKIKVFVAGSGKLANALLSADFASVNCDVFQWDIHYQNLQQKAILVHAGSGRQLKECLAFCKQTKSVFIELSTGMETEKMNPDFPLIICPNTSILVLKTLHMLKNYGHRFQNYEISITESHQSTKKTEAGTAVAFAKALNYPAEQIVSVRDAEIQKSSIGIPDKYLDKHAFHQIIIKDGMDEITLETKVLGHDSYAKGVIRMIEALTNHQLENKRYTVLDMIDLGLL